MKNTVKGIREQEKSQPAAALFREQLRERLRASLYEIVEEEVRQLCGTHYYPTGEGGHYRSGSAPSSVYLQGERQRLKRPRVRRKTEDGSEEAALKSRQLARDPAEWEEAMKRAVLCGVSCRGVSQLRERGAYGESKSSLSRLWRKKAAHLVEDLQNSDLSEMDLLVLMVDAVVLCRDLVATVTLGIDTAGRKRIPGFRVGGSENAEVCGDLLGSLERRGLKAPQGRRLLAVLDGSDALDRSVRRHFPGTLVQRCLIHKERNIRAYLSKRHWSELAGLFRRLRVAQGRAQGEEIAASMKRFLKDKNAQARASFEEAGEDLLTLFRLEAPNTLNVSLLSTNCIENAFKNLRRHIGRVARWRRQTRQADRWLASGLTLAQRTFRKIRGVHDIPQLIRALERSWKQREPQEDPPGSYSHRHLRPA